MKVYAFTFRQNLPVSLTQAWSFFSSPHNLARITPPDMNFVVTTEFEQSKEMYAGMIISYKVSPFTGYTTRWVTEITHVEHEKYFVDEQRFGPYSFWHHQHHFAPAPDGVAMTDILHYAIPYGIIGRLTNRLLVQKRVHEIFNYRKLKIIDIFGR